MPFWLKASRRNVQLSIGLSADAIAALKQRGMDFVGMVFDEKIGDMVMHASIPELSRYSIPRQLQDFRPFGHGDIHEDVRDLMAVRKGNWLFYAFEYSYGTFAGDPTEVRANEIGPGMTLGTFGVVAADISVDLPLFAIDPLAGISELAHRLGFHKMLVESDEFNQRYSLNCSEDKRVSDVLNPQAIEVLLQAPDMTWQMGGRHIVLFEPGGLSTNFAAAATDALMAFTACIPNFVQQDHFASRPNL